ncbi:permease [Gottfriedia sp. NPDC056225]|uniref:permease n=1 Tax=Gottfriedia sp. NPDC056225 TaxID=3345751 RepID=UPI001559235C|nr:permease [Arthrobacter citreus]
MYRHRKHNEQKHNHNLPNDNNDHNEEYSAEFYPTRDVFYTDTTSDKSHATGIVIGYVALFFSLFSLFLMPVLFGIIGIAIGIYSVTKGHSTLGYTAIGFGLFSVIVTIFYNLLIVLSAIL